jgi:putative membrane protein
VLIVGLILAALAAVLHVYIFWMESVAWEGPAARKTFGIGSAEEARVTKSLAFNQGFYNLFLAIMALAGVAVTAAGSTAVGLTLVLSGTGSMLAAALVLLLSSKQHRAAAIKQGTLPLLAVLLTALGALLG